jgi:ceramide glucosyltransferase
MIHAILRVIEVVAVFGAISSSTYYLFCLWSARAFLRDCRTGNAARSTRKLPAVSILKPLKGSDPETYENLRSHCAQEYSEYEIIFGVSDSADPALASVERLQREFSDLPIQVVVCPKILGTNVKVSNLAQMLAAARHGLLIVNDSDIRVERDYLQHVIAPLTHESVGMVTCLYRGVAASTLGSRLESLGIGTDFCAGVLAARQLEGGLRFGLGSTLAFRRRDLEKIGGFQALTDFLADDYELGKRIADLGLQVRLADAVVETHLPAYSLREFFAHQLRWARAIRDSRAGGYFGLLFTFGLMWSALAVIAARGAAWAWGLAGVTVFLRLAVAIVLGKVVLRDPQLGRNLWLLPLRDLFAVGVWMASFAGHTVTWRGDRFELKRGRLVRNATR